MIYLNDENSIIEAGFPFKLNILMNLKWNFSAICLISYLQILHWLIKIYVSTIWHFFSNDKTWGSYSC